jgi:hypothetical protein
MKCVKKRDNFGKRIVGGFKKLWRGFKGCPWYDKAMLLLATLGNVVFGVALFVNPAIIPFVAIGFGIIGTIQTIRNVFGKNGVGRDGNWKKMSFKDKTLFLTKEVLRTVGNVVLAVAIGGLAPFLASSTAFGIVARASRHISNVIRQGINIYQSVKSGSFRNSGKGPIGNFIGAVCWGASHVSGVAFGAPDMLCNIFDATGVVSDIAGDSIGVKRAGKIVKNSTVAKNIKARVGNDKSGFEKFGQFEYVPVIRSAISRNFNETKETAYNTKVSANSEEILENFKVDGIDLTFKFVQNGEKINLFEAVELLRKKSNNLKELKNKIDIIIEKTIRKSGKVAEDKVEKFTNKITEKIIENFVIGKRNSNSNLQLEGRTLRIG